MFKSQSDTTQYYGRVVKVTAGDNLDVKHGHQIDHVRLYNVRCPAGDMGAAAEAFTRDLTLARGVRVYKLRIDSHGTVWSEVVFLGGHTLSGELLKAGLARLETQAANNVVLAQAQTQARLEHRGLWAASTPPEEVVATSLLH